MRNIEFITLTLFLSISGYDDTTSLSLFKFPLKSNLSSVIISQSVVDRILSITIKSFFSNLYLRLSEFKLFGFFINVTRSLSLNTNFRLIFKFIHFSYLHSKIFFNFNKFKCFVLDVYIFFQ